MLSSRRQQRGQMFVEMVLVVPFLLLFLLGGAAVGLSILATSQAKEAAGNAASVAARTDACSNAQCPGPSCPSTVVSAANEAVQQTLAEGPYRNGSAANDLYGIVPDATIVITVTCPHGFYRSYDPTTGLGEPSGGGTPAPITVSVSGKIEIGFLPFFNNFNFTESRTAEISPYRSRSVP